MSKQTASRASQLQQTVRSTAGRVVNRLLEPLGLELRQRADSCQWPSTLQRARRWGVDVATILDVGASDGRWTRMARRVFPRAAAVLFEANPVHEAALARYCRRRPDSAYRLRVVGDRPGTAFFDASHAYIGVASLARHREDDVMLPMTSLDAARSAEDWRPPYLLKLDTHGFELPILAGAMATLPHCSLVVIEAYNFRVGADSPRFHELVATMGELGFRPLDLAEPVHRPRDGALWQMDLLFVPAGSLPDDDDVYRGFGMRRERGRLSPGWERLAG